MLADRYASLRASAAGRVGERAAADLRHVSELEIQARWFAGEFGTRFRTRSNEEIEVIQFGVWNREAGPDFAEAAVSFDGAPPQRGAIELDHEARDWERHGHATNGDYNQVVLHVVTHTRPPEFFTRTSVHRHVPQVLLDGAMLGGAAPNPLPFAKPGKCVAPLAALAFEQVSEIVEAAAHFRLRAKGTRLAQLAKLHGEDEALYQALAGTFGYKSNKLPFTVLAQRLPLHVLRRDPVQIEALLYGNAGFLDGDLAEHEPDARGYLRSLWDRWWRRRAEFSRLAMAPVLWRLSGHRPVNHPHRRLAALAQLVRGWSELRAAWRSGDPAVVRKFFGGLSDPYWNTHYTLTSPPAKRPMALVGSSRVAEVLANVFFPAVCAANPARWEDYRKLPSALTNRRVETAGTRLFGGRTAARLFTKTVVHQQGLLQIYEDFCMQDNSDCMSCLFPAQAAAWDAVATSL